MADEKMIITIGREHGTMGDKVAEKIRRQFELPLYDKAHLLRIVEETDDYDELNAFFNDRKVNSLLYAIAMSENVSSNDVPFGIIKKIIGNTGGVVMDSCGNYLFRDRPNTVRIFMHADKLVCMHKNSYRIRTISEKIISTAIHHDASRITNNLLDNPERHIIRTYILTHCNRI